MAINSFSIKTLFLLLVAFSAVAVPEYSWIFSINAAQAA